MTKYRYISLCALVGLACSSLFLNIDAQEAQESADLIFLIDGSENVGAANFPRVRTMILNVIERLSVGREAIRVALVQYSADPQIHFYLNSHYSRATVSDAVKELRFLGGAEANLGAALEEVAESLMGPEAGGRAEEGVPQVVVVISAGASRDDVSEGERAIKRKSAFIFIIGIGRQTTADLDAIATEQSYVLSAPDISALAQLRDPLLSYINGVAQHSIVLEADITEVLAVGKRDIIFLIDGSQNMGATQFNAVREFIKKFLSSVPIGRDQVQVGVAVFTSSASAEIHLNSHDTKEALSSALNRMRLKGGTQVVNVGAALEFVRTQMLRQERGSRIQEGVPQLLLLLSAKKSSDSVTQPAAELQRMGVLTLAAGSKNADEAELKTVAFDEKVAFTFKDFRFLIRQPQQIIDFLVTLSSEGPTETVTEITTVQTQLIMRDIVFIVDGSSYVGNANVQFVREFIAGVINRLEVRPDRVRVGLMQFAGEQRTEFYLNTYSSKEDVLKAVAQFRLMGGTALKTGAALEFALATHFQPSAGSRRRQGIQQVLVLITGGQSQDEVKRVADKVAVAGVLTFAIGAGRVDENFLRTVAFVPDLAYYENAFSTLPNVVGRIITPLITVVGDTENIPVEEDEYTGNERDVAFLIDGSDAVGPDFAYVRDFILKVIEPLDVALNKVRISVVQHSETPSPNFYLNTYTTKDDVIRAINGMRLAGGRTLNTGAALTFMKDTGFSPDRGGRAAENVPQFLIVLTGARSRDNVRDSASALKTGGVVPFGIGVKNADRSQIEAISHNPSFAFNVKDFSQLNTVQQRIGSYVSLSKDEIQAVLQQDAWKAFLKC